MSTPCQHKQNNSAKTFDFSKKTLMFVMQ